MQHTFPKFPKKTIKCESIGSDGNDLLNQMLQINPDQRITLDKALKHPYFRDIHDRKMDIE
jgi:mitogen-activated protein kinase 1/3